MVKSFEKQFMDEQNPGCWFSAIVESNRHASDRQIDEMWNDTLRDRMSEFKRKHHLTDDDASTVEKNIKKIYLG
jgi:hypothetical protein